MSLKDVNEVKSMGNSTGHWRMKRHKKDTAKNFLEEAMQTHNLKTLF